MYFQVIYMFDAFPQRLTRQAAYIVQAVPSYGRALLSAIRFFGLVGANMPQFLLLGADTYLTEAPITKNSLFSVIGAFRLSSRHRNVTPTDNRGLPCNFRKTT